MSFKLLKQLIAHLRKKTSCPYCKARFGEDSIFVLASGLNINQESGAGLFFLICPKCASQAYVMVEISSAGSEMVMPEIRHMQTKPTKNISINEILDMHNFLKQWEGEDVKELFNEI